MITQTELKKLLDYDPDTGEFRWKIKRSGVKFNSIPGRINNTGYKQIMLNKKRYLAHRLAWLYVFGDWPNKLLDHINLIKTDNRIDNLRECTHAENFQNKKNTIGYSYHKKAKKWIAQIKINGKNIYLGLFDTEEEARTAYLNAKANIHLFNPVPIEERI